MTPVVAASTAEGGGDDDTTESDSENTLENNTELAPSSSNNEEDDAEVQPAAESRVKRQLTSQLGNANLGDGESIQVEKHQYDVKKIANQVDTGKNLYESRLTKPLVAALGIVALSSRWMYFISRDQVISEPVFTKCIKIQNYYVGMHNKITLNSNFLNNSERIL